MEDREKAMQEKKKMLLYIGIGLVATGGVFIYFMSSSLFASAPEGGSGVHENLIMHMHVQLELFVGDESVTVPEEIGIKPELWQDHSLDRYSAGNLAPIHTHDATGVLHVESVTIRQFTFGEFADIWGFDLNNIESMRAGGEEVSDYMNYVLKDRERITIELRESI